MLCYQGYCYIIHLKSWFKDIKLTFQFLILFFNPQYQCTTQDDAANLSSATGGGYCGSGLVVADQVLGDHAATYDGGSCGVGGFLLPEPEVSIQPYTTILLLFTLCITLSYIYTFDLLYYFIIP